MTVRQPGLDKLKAELELFDIIEQTRNLTPVERAMKSNILATLSRAADY